METRRLYQQVADQIRDLIHEGQFPSGGRLPSERDLAQQLGVSRPSLREALIALEIEGRVEIRMGSGVYVGEPQEAPARLTRALGESPSELVQARSALESATVTLACARMSPTRLAQLRDIIDAMAADIAAGQRPLERDRAFHLAIAEQAGNSVITRLISELFDQRHSPLSLRLTARAETEETWIVAQAEHEAVFAALDAADPVAAQAAMVMHLGNSATRWLGR